jgi:hypothetical protein
VAAATTNYTCNYNMHSLIYGYNVGSISPGANLSLATKTTSLLLSDRYQLNLPGHGRNIRNLARKLKFRVIHCSHDRGRVRRGSFRFAISRNCFEDLLRRRLFVETPNSPWLVWPSRRLGVNVEGDGRSWGKVRDDHGVVGGGQGADDLSLVVACR